MTEEKKEIKDVDVSITDNKEEKIVQVIEKKSDTQQKNVSKIWHSGFWVRGAAHIIDGLVIFGIVIVIGIPLSVFFGFFSVILGPLGFILQFAMSFLGLFIAWGYFIFMTHKYQATLGKMAVGIKVTAETGEKLTLKNIALREIVGKFVAGFIMGIGYLMIAFTSKKQGLHDMIAKSVVVYKDATRGPNTIVVVLVYITIVFLMIGLVVVIALIIFAIITAVAAGTSMDTGTFVNMIQQGVDGEGIDIVPMIMEGMEEMEGSK